MALSRLLPDEDMASFPAMEGETEALRSGRERKARLFFQHPPASPEVTGVLPYLIHPPTALSSNARWHAFRERTLLPMIAARPDDPNLPNFLRQVEVVLAWRAAVPVSDHFWKADETQSLQRGSASALQTGNPRVQRFR